MRTILEDIKNNQYKNVYLLYGEEAYLKNQYRQKLLSALVPEGDTMNLHVYEDADVSVKEIIDLAETMPFFATYRIIAVKDSGLFKKGGEELAEYLAGMPESTILIFTEQEVDKRSKLFKAVKEKGRAVEFSVQDENTLQKWILGILKKEDKKITQQTLLLLLEKTGTDMANISSELEKLVCYTMGRDVITSEDVEAVCTTRVTSRIFEMVGAVAEKNQKKALELYYDLLTLKEPPMRILFLIARQFNILLQVKELRRKGADNRQIGEKVGLPPFIAGKYVTQAAGFQQEELRRAIEECVSAEEAVKTGQMNDVMSVEILIVKYSRRKS
ncbi:MAG: DNA polymerase III subunit delta [Lachnospiraceae bacterium]